MDQDNEKNDNSVESGYRNERQEWNYQGVSQQPVKSPQSNMALASLIMGIIGLVTFCSCLGGLIFGSLGIIFALLSKTDDKFEGYAKAGLITSSIAVALGILAIVVIIIMAVVDGIWAGGRF